MSKIINKIFQGVPSIRTIKNKFNDLPKYKIREVLNTYGLFFAFVGSILIALSIIEYPYGYVKSIDGLTKYYNAIISHNLSQWGFIIMILGFLSQIISALIKISDDIEYKRKCILRIIVEYTNGNIGTGSGFFINNKGNLITCFHVAFGGELRKIRQDQDFISYTDSDEHSKLKTWFNSKIKKISAELNNGSKEELELDNFDEQHDIVLLKLTNKKLFNNIEYCEIDFKTQLNQGDSILFGGFPMCYSYTNLNTPFAINTGIVSSFPEIEIGGGKYKHVQINSINLGGNSGAPLFLKNTNKVVGIINGNMSQGADNVLFLNKQNNQATAGNIQIPLTIAYATEFMFLKSEISILL